MKLALASVMRLAVFIRSLVANRVRYVAAA